MNWRDSGGKGKRKPQAAGSPAPPGDSSPPPDWRSRKPRGDEAPPRRGRTWSTRTTDPAAARRTAFRLRLFGILALAGILAALLIAKLLWVPLKTQIVLVAPGDSSRGTWRATKAWNRATRDSFRAVANDNSNLVVLADGTDPFFNPASPWDEAIRALGLKPLGPDRRLLIYFLSAPAVVREEGGEATPYFLPTTDHPLEDPEHWIPIEQLLKAIAESAPARGQAQALVLLDAQRVEPIVAPGLLYDRFPGAVNAACRRLQAAGYDQLHVVVSHSDGERNWQLPEVGCSAFAYVLQRALRGEADGLSRPDGTVSLVELARFLQRGLPGYIADRRQAVQTPTIISPALQLQDNDWQATKPAGELGVVFVDRASFRRWHDEQAQAGRRPALLPADLTARQAQLDEAWQQFAQLRAQNALERFPVLAAEAAALLVRQEQLYLEPDTHEASELQRQLRQRFAEMQLPAVDRGDSSLAIARLRGSSNLAAGNDAEQHMELWRELRRLRDGMASTDEATRQKTTEEFKLFQTGPLTTLPPWQLLQLVWTGWIRQAETSKQNPAPWGRFSAEDLQFWTERLANNPIGPLPPLESQLLQMLQTQVDWSAEHPLAAACLYLALQTHDQAEQIVYATRMQPEILPWIQPALTVAEQVRRQGEDLLMASQFGEAHDRLHEANQQLTAISAQLAQVQQAVLLRNQVAFAAPHLLMWMLRQNATAQGRRLALGAGTAAAESPPPAGSAAAPAPPAEFDIAAWLSTLQALNELDSILASNPPGAATSRSWGEWEQGKAQALRDQFAALGSTFGTFAQNLESRSSDTTTLVDIENALLNPLLNTTVRGQLRRRHAEILQGYADRPIPDFSSYKPRVDAQGETPTQFAEMIRQLADAAGRDLSDPTWRPLLESSFALTWDAVVVPGQHAPFQQQLQASESPPSLIADCGRLIPIEGVLRRVAHGLAELPNTAGLTWQAQARAVSVDLFQKFSELQTCFEASRVLQDCWGNNEWLPVGTAPPLPPYFVRAAQTHLGRLEKTSALQTREVQTLREQLDRYQAAVTRIGVSAPAVVYQPDIPDTPLTIELELPPELPAGIAAAMVRDPRDLTQLVEVKQQGTDAAIRKHPVATAGSEPGRDAASGWSLFLPVQKHLRGEKSRVDFDAALAFRGHARFQLFRAERAKSSTVAAPEEVLVGWTPVPLGPPSIEVRKEVNNITDVIVVFDCSGSMAQPLQIVGEAGKVNTTRFKHLKDALEDLLTSMKATGSFRVALVAFGHRVRHWKRSPDAAKNSIMYSDETKGAQEWKGILPHTDATVVFSALGQAGPMSAAGYDQLTEDLKLLSPYGQTPLYYAIKYAAEQFPLAADEHVPRQIIVVTDGMNRTYEFDAEGDLRERSSEAGSDSDFGYYNELVRGNSATDLLRGIQVHVVAVDVAKEDDESDDQFARKKAQLEKIAQASGGKTLYPKSIGDLKQHLDRVVNSESWTVRGESGDLDSGELRLGTTWTPAADTSFRPGFFDIGLTNAQHSQRVYLEGGEMIVLEFDRDRQLRFRRDGNLNLLRSQSRVLGGGDTGGQYTIGLLYPNTHREENELAFSFQNEDPRRFSQRPQRVCLEVLPADGAAKHTFFLQDYNVETKRQEPVIRFPKVALSPGQNTLRLWVLPFSPQPLSFERVVEVSANRETTAKWDNIDVQLVRGERGLEAQLRGGDPAERQTMLVDLLVDRGQGWERIPTVPTVRRFLVDGSANFHEFRWEGELEHQRLAIGLSKLATVFSPDNAVVFDEITLTPK